MYRSSTSIDRTGRCLGPIWLAPAMDPAPGTQDVRSSAAPKVHGTRRNAMSTREEALGTAALGAPVLFPVWEDLVFSEPELPDDYTKAPESFEDTPPPQLVRTINLLPIPEHGVRGPEDVEGIAAHLLARAKEGIADLF